MELLDHDLEVHDSQPLPAVVADVGRPRATLDVDQDTGCDNIILFYTNINHHFFNKK